MSRDRLFTYDELGVTVTLPDNHPWRSWPRDEIAKAFGVDFAQFEDEQGERTWQDKHSKE